MDKLLNLSEVYFPHMKILGNSACFEKFLRNSKSCNKQKVPGMNAQYSNLFYVHVISTLPACKNILKVEIIFYIFLYYLFCLVHKFAEKGSGE